MAHFKSEQDSRIPSANIDTLSTQFLSKVLRRKAGLPRPKDKDLPWESWELDKDFFRALSQWTLTHPETTLDRVLDSIAEGLDNSGNIMDMIPDAPFPARGLLTALAHLFKLGVTISRAKREVQEFAKGVIRWVGQVKTAFESRGEGHFTRLVWQNLRDMRDIVVEVCSWAVKRLEDQRWSKIAHGLSIQTEIQEFNARIADARKLFQDLSVISLAKGLDVVIHRLRKLSHRQQVIITAIKNIRETQERQLGKIINELESQKLTAERDRFLTDALAGHTVADPTYDKQGKNPCDPDTRVEVLAEIDKWIHNLSPGAKNFLWLTGDPGCGKSAVTASVSKECKQQDILWAQFFINRNNAETTDPNSYFPSIASQLARRSVDVAEALRVALQENRTLPDTISADQAAKLFIDSIRCASRLDPKQPVVVVIDGLDETDRKRLEDTANIFSTLFTALTAYGNVKVFISSRTENEIQNSFILPLHDTHVKRIHLDTTDPSSIQDVSYYIKRNLLELVKKHDLNWIVWPGDERSRMLGQRASGLFIWGVTAIKFIQDRLQSDGKESLNEVLDLLTADVLDDINSLYTLILKVTYGPRPSEWELERFRRIVGAIVCLQEPLCINDLAALLDLRRTPSSDLADIPHFVRRFRTILVTGTDIIDGTTIPRVHKSVYEFITSEGLDARFRVEPRHAHLELGMQCLAQLRLTNIPDTKRVLPALFRYASRFWSPHLSQADVMGARNVCADCSHRSPPHPSQPLKSTESRITKYSATESHIYTIHGDSVKSWDALDGTNLSDHTDNVTCLAFSPDGKQTLSGSLDRTIRVWSSTNGRWIRTLVKHSAPISAMAVSSDGRWVVSASEDELRLWDFSTGAPLGLPFQGHKDRVRCVAISPDGQHVISGSDDKTCILWNVRSSQLVGRPWTSHHYHLKSIAFSSNGRRVCSLDSGGYCCVWDVSSGQKVRGWPDNRVPMSACFSPKNDNVIMVGGGKSIEIRSENQQWSIPASKHARCMSFSSDAKQVVFATPHSVSVAEVGEDQGAARISKQGNYSTSSGAVAFALSPDLYFFAYANRAVHVYALRAKEALLALVPFSDLRPAATQTNGDNHELRDPLSSLREVKRNDDNLTHNRRLDAIKWYDEPIVKTDNGVEPITKFWVITDDTTLLACDTSVSVWNRRNLHQAQE